MPRKVLPPNNLTSPLGKLGIWALVNEFTASESAAFAKRVEAWGYSTLWLPEALGREPLVASSWLLANTSRLQVATGVMNIYARDCMAAANGQYGLAEQSGNRFLMGIGVSHPPLVEDFRGHRYHKPLRAMGVYLDGLAQIHYLSPPPTLKPPTLIAALGPRMLELAAERTDGVHTYNVTPEHSARARQILGADKLLCVEQKVILETDPAIARGIGRRVIGHSLNLPAYRNNFLRMGFSEEDLANGGSNRLIDGLVAWGDERAIGERLQQHLDAGADQVCIQSLAREGMKLARQDERIFELLAPG